MKIRRNRLWDSPPARKPPVSNGTGFIPCRGPQCLGRACLPDPEDPYWVGLCGKCGRVYRRQVRGTVESFLILKGPLKVGT